MVADHTSENQEFTDYHFYHHRLFWVVDKLITASQSVDYTKMDYPKSSVLNGVLLKQLLFIYLHMPCSLSSPWPKIISIQKGT